MLPRAIESALAQDYPRLELVVVDDGSSDGTRDVLKRYRQSGVRVHSNPKTIGASRTHNVALALAGGELIKFLHDDDELDPRCVSELARAFDAGPQIGMTFCRRRIAEEGEGLEDWARKYGSPHHVLGELQAVNPGPALLRRWMGEGLKLNCIGEPSNVMLRRTALAEAGGFHRYMIQEFDMDMWVRLLARFDVGFVDAELSTYRHHAESLTGVNKREKRAWLDRLWMLEGLAGDPRIVREHPQVLEWRSRELSVAWRTSVAHRDPTWPRARRLRDVGRYLAFRMRGLGPRPPSLFGSLEGLPNGARSP